MKKNIYTGMSLFSNAGIGDMGVEEAGVNVLVANELLKERCETYKLNHKHTNVLCGDINNIDFNDVKSKYFKEEPFLMVCTPPCQGVSVAGRQDKFDIRNQLIKPAVNAIKILQPKWLWIENVPTYKAATIPDTLNIVDDNESYERINVLDFINRELSSLGYTMKYEILDAKNYGVPQTRKRLIIILTKTGKEITFPTKTHGDKSNTYVTVRQAIGHLESLKSGEKSETDKYHFAKVHNERHIKWMDATPEGCTALDNEDLENRPNIIDKITGELRPIKAFKTTYRRMYWDKPAPTVTMSSGSISSQNNVHPKDSRAMTVREAMLLQTLPSNYKFPEWATDKNMRDMVGEAVPSLFAEVITKHIIDMDKK